MKKIHARIQGMSSLLWYRQPFIPSTSVVIVNSKAMLLLGYQTQHEKQQLLLLHSRIKREKKAEKKTHLKNPN